MPTANPVDRTIQIAVDTDALWAKPYPNTPETDIDNCTFMSDGVTTNRYNTPKKDFETVVYRGKKVIWTIANQNVSDVGVRLVSVTHNPTEGNPNYFNQNPLNVGQHGSVQGVVLNLDNLPDDNYTIHIKLVKGTEERTYPIDPKLKISTRT